VKKLNISRHPGENRGPVRLRRIKALKELDSGFRRNDMKKNQINFFTASGGQGGIFD
jgi:hypothetical protein